MQILPRSVSMEFGPCNSSRVSQNRKTGPDQTARSQMRKWQRLSSSLPSLTAQCQATSSKTSALAAAGPGNGVISLRGHRQHSVPRRLHERTTKPISLSLSLHWPREQWAWEGRFGRGTGCAPERFRRRFRSRSRVSNRESRSTRGAPAAIARSRRLAASRVRASRPELQTLRELDSFPFPLSCG